MINSHVFSYYFVGDKMLKEKALKKIFITTIAIFIVLVIYSIKQIGSDVTVFDDAYYIESSDKSVIYALNKDNYISKTTVYVNNKLSIEEKVKNLLEIMTTKNNKNALLPSYFKPILPKNTKVEKVELDQDILKVTFNQALMDIDAEQSEKMLEAIIYTLTEFDEVLGIEIYVENNLLKYVPHSKKQLTTMLDRDFGINKVYNLDNLNNINKVSLYYLSYNNDDFYYVPITKYLNDEREKIELIVEYLSNSYIYEEPLKSFLNVNTKLKDYKIENKVMTLTFSEDIIDSTEFEIIKKESINPILLSVFDNYDVQKVEIIINDNKILEKTKKDIE